MSLFSIKNLKKSSVYITPNFPTLQTQRYKFKFFSIVNFILLFILFISVMVVTFLALTPAKEYVFILENKELNKQAERINVLEEKIVFLSSELYRISSTTQRLKYAMILASTDSLDSTAAIYDSLRKTEGNRIPPEGSILTVVEKIFNDLFYQSESNVVFIKPITGILHRKYDPAKGHLGVDFSIKTGTPVYASAEGTIIFANYTAKDGFSLIIQHDNNYLSIYKHCSIIIKNERENVKRGEIIALSGNSGSNTTGPHLHFEIWKNSKPINPEKVFIK